MFISVVIDPELADKGGIIIGIKSISVV
jgi:hypothetical protein